MGKTVLALDLATHLGWCVGDHDQGDPTSGHFKLPSTGEDVGAFIDAYDRWLVPMLSEHQPALVTFENPIVQGSGKTTLSTTMKLVGLAVHTEFRCRRFTWKRDRPPIEVANVNVGSWKVSFCGGAKFSKETKPYPPIKRCHELGWSWIKNDNEADARGIWCHTIGSMGTNGARFTPLGRLGLAA